MRRLRRRGEYAVNAEREIKGSDLDVLAAVTLQDEIGIED
jgi:hypothetical protein